MQKSNIYRLVGLAVALAAALAFVLVNLGPTVAKADEWGRERRPYTTHVTCNTWVPPDYNICYVNIDPIPKGKRFVVEYVTVLAYTDQASDQKVAVDMTFQTGSSTAITPWVVYPVLYFQLTSPWVPTVNWWHASEKVLAFAENVSPKTSGQLYVTRYPVPASGYNTAVTLWASGYLEEK